MRCMVFIVVRSDSKRLPKKALLKIRNKPLIKFLIDRINSAKVCKDIVVCTTLRKIDEPLVNYLKKNKITVFRGSNKDILSRIYRAAIKFNVNQFVIVEADDIFCEPLLISKTCDELKHSKNDFVIWEDVPFGSAPTGIKTKKLAKLIDIKKTRNTETGWIKFIIDSGVFKVKKMKPKTSKLRKKELRLSVDYKQDFKLAQKIIGLLPEKFSLYDIIKLFEEKPELIKINESVKKMYSEKFQKK